MNKPTGFSPDKIFNVQPDNFVAQAVRVFGFQYQFNKVYREYCHLRMGNVPSDSFSKNTLTPEKIPFLPISFFKTHRVQCGDDDPQKVFTSSGTTGMEVSRHFVNDLSLYEQSFLQGFRAFYVDPGQYAVLCLLPSYLEREGSSLIYMCQKLIEQSGDGDSGFFLHAKGKLMDILEKREKAGQKTLLIGVSFALIGFAEENPLPLNQTIVMETGGMKGRKREMTRMELHGILKDALGVPSIHSEYGMTELLSQAYSSADGLFHCPPWMRVFVREEDDPGVVKRSGTGMLCIVDLANIYSCSFIETADVGRVYPDGSFEVLGRIDQSDIRGCSLLVL
ncbi:MAG: acyl transferase [Chitinophagaceae bacterium]|nr:acyl transferase [Chitinophagaceae bacterium]